MKRVLIAAAATAAIAAGAVQAHDHGERRPAASAEHNHEKHAERHQRMAERHQRMAERHGEHRHGGGDKPAAPAEQPKPEEHKH